MGILIPNHQEEIRNIPSQYEILEQNISLFNQYRIETNLLEPQDNEILLKNPIELRSIIELLMQYGISFSDSNSYIFLRHPTLIPLLDIYLELNLYPIFIQFLPQLTQNENVLKRILILKSINNNILNDYGKISSSTINGKNFYIPDGSLDEYILNHVRDYQDESIQSSLNDQYWPPISEETMQLDSILNLERNYKINDLLYSFEGILISRIKVLRNMEKLKEDSSSFDTQLLNAILNNSYLDSEQIERIKACICPKEKQYS